jgi:hypothetical protein
MALQIKIGADVSGAVSGLSGMAKSVDILQKQIERLQRIAANPNLGTRQYERVTALMAATQRQADALGKTMRNSVVPGSNQATLALSNLSRVAQDAPYGFIGIANNLNPLLESFQRLKQSTGSTGGALKALGSSLLGAGGVGLALGVVSSLLVTFGDRLFGAKEKAEASKKIFDELSNSIDNQKRSLDDLISNYEYLSRLSDINLQINFGDKGNALGIQGDIIQFQEELLKIDDSYKQLVDERSKAFDLNRSGELNDKDFTEQTKKFDERSEELLKKRTETQRNYNIATRQLELQKKNDAEKAAAEAKALAEKQAAEYEKWVNEMISKGKKYADFFKDRLNVPNFSPLDTKSDELKKSLSFLNTFSSNYSSLLKNKVPFTFDFDGAFQNLQEELKEMKMDGPAKFKLGIPVAILNASEEFNKMKALAIQNAEQIKAVFSSAFQNIAGGIGQALGDAFSGKENFGEPIINALGDFLIQLGKTIIEIGVIKKVIDKLLASFSFSGGAAIAIGLSAIAIGTAIKNFAGFRAEGGPVAPGGSYIVGERGPEIFTPSVPGNIIPNNQITAGNRTRGVGGGGAMQVVVSGYISGNGLRLVQARSDRQGRRLYGQ